MSDAPTPTPETDAALYPMNQVDIVWPEFARKLERERDEARKQRDRLAEALHDVKHTSSSSRLRRVANEALTTLTTTQPEQTKL
jgi:hypothetical protein